jgi:hypothetical protein
MSAECFSAALSRSDGKANRADWCYSRDGVLLASLVVLAERGTIMLEATKVSRGVTESDFDAPTGRPNGTVDLLSIAGTLEFAALKSVRLGMWVPGFTLRLFALGWTVPLGRRGSPARTSTSISG